MGGCALKYLHTISVTAQSSRSVVRVLRQVQVFFKQLRSRMEMTQRLALNYIPSDWGFKLDPMQLLSDRLRALSPMAMR